MLTAVRRIPHEQVRIAVALGLNILQEAQSIKVGCIRRKRGSSPRSSHEARHADATASYCRHRVNFELLRQNADWIWRILLCNRRTRSCKMIHCDLTSSSGPDQKIWYYATVRAKLCLLKLVRHPSCHSVCSKSCPKAEACTSHGEIANQIPYE